MRQLGNKAHKELSYAVVDLNWDDGTWEQSGNAFTLCKMIIKLIEMKLLFFLVINMLLNAKDLVV